MTDWTDIPAALPNPFRMLVARARRIGAEIHRRRRIGRMLDLDDRMLNDAGVTRADIYRVTGLPLDLNATQELERIKADRRRRRFR